MNGERTTPLEGLVSTELKNSLPIVGAYESVQGDGLMAARVGAGSFVAPEMRPGQPATPAAAQLLPGAMENPLRAFALGVPMVDKAFQQRLAAAVRRHMLGDDLAALDICVDRALVKKREWLNNSQRFSSSNGSTFSVSRPSAGKPRPCRRYNHDVIPSQRIETGRP